MKKIKKLWEQNRVLFALFIIIFVCLLIVIGVFASYFFGTTKSSYGDRLSGIENVKITEEMENNFLNSLKSDEQISDTNIKIRGKVVYITIYFKEGISLVEAESKALASLQQFDESYQKFYDFNYTLKQEATENSEGFLIMGAKNINGSGLIWNNNTEISKEE